MKGYRFLPPAEEEMTEASRYYERASSGLGQEFLDDLQQTAVADRDHPGIGRPAGAVFRQTPIRIFPFLLIYADEQDDLVVVAVAHQKRRPGYWRTRWAKRILLAEHTPVRIFRILRASQPNSARLQLPSGLVQGLAHRREQVGHHRAGAEVDFGRDQHA